MRNKKMSDKAKAAMAKVVEKFKAGDLSEVVEVARLRLPDDAPASKWSFSNRALAFLQTGCLDCRNYGAWQGAGRQVQGGTSAAFIWKPKKYKSTDKETGEVKWIVWAYDLTPVHPYTNTAPMPGREDEALTYEPKDPPPLAEIAGAMGIEFDWHPTADCLGWCTPDGAEIAAGTHDAAVFFHELAHAVDARLSENGKLKGGQDAEQETVAEFTATVLMEYYGLGDRTGNAWRYIKRYADDPLDAIKKALGRIGAIVGYLEEVADA